jgi:hypothetical protein
VTPTPSSQPRMLDIKWMRPFLAAAALAVAGATLAPAPSSAQELAAAPALTFGTYVGGAGDDWGHDTAVDPQGNIIITGRTYSKQFPGASGTQENTDAFVTKLNPSGSAVIFSTIIAGAEDEEGLGVAVDAQGTIWVTGTTESTNLATKGALKGSYSGGNHDTFVARLTPGGEVTDLAYVGDDATDTPGGIALDPQGNAYIAGSSEARFGPLARIMKIAADGSEMLYHGYFGAAERGFDNGTRATAIAVDSKGQAYIVGNTNIPNFPVVNGLFTQCGDFERTGGECDYRDAFLSVVNAEGSDLIYSTYLGGTISDEATGVALDKDENIYVTGTTFSDNFPVQSPFQGQKVGPDNFADAFLTKFSPQGDALLYSTYYAGDAWDEPDSLIVDGAGNAYIGGLTSSNDLPVPNAIQGGISGICFVGSTERYCYDGFVAAFSPAGALSWATYLGGTFDDSVKGLALASDGGLIVGGRAESHGFPTTQGSFQPTKAMSDDAFVVKIGGASGGDPGPGPGPDPAKPFRVSLPVVRGR